jgi:hypothetical protein
MCNNFRLLNYLADVITRLAFSVLFFSQQGFPPSNLFVSQKQRENTFIHLREIFRFNSFPSFLLSGILYFELSHYLYSRKKSSTFDNLISLKMFSIQIFILFLFPFKKNVFFIFPFVRGAFGSLSYFSFHKLHGWCWW